MNILPNGMEKRGMSNQNHIRTSRNYADGSWIISALSWNFTWKHFGCWMENICKTVSFKLILKVMIYSFEPSKHFPRRAKMNSQSCRHDEAKSITIAIDIPHLCLEWRERGKANKNQWFVSNSLWKSPTQSTAARAWSAAKISLEAFSLLQVVVIEIFDRIHPSSQHCGSEHFRYRFTKPSNDCRGEIITCSIGKSH